MHFEVDSGFAEQFATLIRSAPVRQVILEQTIRHRIERALDPPDPEQAPPTVHLDDGYGLLIVETGLPDTPDLMVTFHYEGQAGDTLVTLFRVHAVEPLPDEEDGPP